MTGDLTFSQRELDTLSAMQPMVSGSRSDRFIQTCVDYYNEWHDTHAARMDANLVPAGQALVLVYAEAPRISLGLPENVATSPTRVWRKTCALEDGLAVCNENLEVMLKVVPKFADANDAMNFVSANLSLDHVFAVVLVAQRKILIHQSGLEVETWIANPHEIKINPNSVTITPDVIAHEMQRFHHEYTRLPLGAVSRLMWKADDKKVWLDTKPELRVQSTLLPYLRGCFRHAGALVDEEISNPGGRVDIRIHRTNPMKPSSTTTTMLELKVLAPDKSQATNLAWALRGIEQVVKYRSLDTDACFACIFDARSDKSDSMPALATEAINAKVRLEHYEMELPKLKPAKVRKNDGATQKKNETIKRPSKRAQGA
jgi:hypothetical protein